MAETIPAIDVTDEVELPTNHSLPVMWVARYLNEHGKQYSTSSLVSKQDAADRALLHDACPDSIRVYELNPERKPVVIDYDRAHDVACHAHRKLAPAMGWWLTFKADIESQLKGGK